MEKVKIKKLKDCAILPKRASDGSAGYDLTLPEDVVITHGRQIVPLHFAMELPKGLCAKIDPRSGYSSKGMEGFGSEWAKRADQKLRFNADVLHGLIDSDYRGNVGVMIKNDAGTFYMPAGTRIAQMTFEKVECPELEFTDDDLTDTDRGEGGFGKSNENGGSYAKV